MGDKSAKAYRVAVIGRTGKGNYGHGLDVAWKSVENVEIVAVADEDEKGRAAAATRLGVKNTYADYKEMGGIKKATKVQVKRDGEKFMDQEITEFKAVDKHDPKTFEQPE